MISVKNLQHTYSSNKILRFPDFHCEKGEQMLILGQSGCGKTTLLQLLGGMLGVQQGSVFIQNTEINRLKNSELDKFRGKNIGFIFQQHHFLGALNVEENLLLAQELAGIKKDKTQIKVFLEKLNVAHQLKVKPNALSQGEQQRIAIARALIHQPALILADEPSSALDDENCEEVIDLLQEQARLHQTTLLIVTHDKRLKDKFSKKLLFDKKIT
jgi:ABC-type lipoprotein export system ATPase subunit